MDLLLQHDLRVIARGRGVSNAELRRGLAQAVAAVEASRVPSAARVVIPQPRQAGVPQAAEVAVPQPRATGPSRLRRVEMALTAEVRVEGWHVHLVRQASAA